VDSFTKEMIWSTLWFFHVTVVECFGKMWMGCHLIDPQLGQTKDKVTSVKKNVSVAHLGNAKI
jgi:hypothetical protein